MRREKYIAIGELNGIAKGIVRDGKRSRTVEEMDRSMKPRKPFLLRLDPAVHAAIEQWAEQELRSVNGQIEWILRNAVRERFGREPVAEIVADEHHPSTSPAVATSPPVTHGPSGPPQTPEAK